MLPCKNCGQAMAAQSLGLCPDCLRHVDNPRELASRHTSVRAKFGLPPAPPRNPRGRVCRFCANACSLGPGESGFCGVRRNERGRIRSIPGPRSALAHAYLDPLPTNCCAAWFCRGSNEKGFNLAVFFYGCSFDCLFCQNSSHKNISHAPILSEDELLREALSPKVRCVCFFGGSPEPQLDFAVRASRRIIRESDNTKHICWEWNGSGHPELVKEAAKLSRESGGTVKFDIKAHDPNIGFALCGLDLGRTYENFSLLATMEAQKDILTATTLLVPYYVDAGEVEGIARFLAKYGDIPYSLLVFHPDFMMADLPVTPRQQVEECARVARDHLRRVSVGNLHLLGRDMFHL